MIVHENGLVAARASAQPWYPFISCTNKYIYSSFPQVPEGYPLTFDMINSTDETGPFNLVPDRNKYLGAGAKKSHPNILSCSCALAAKSGEYLNCNECQGFWTFRPSDISMFVPGPQSSRRYFSVAEQDGLSPEHSDLIPLCLQCCPLSLS